MTVFRALVFSYFVLLPLLNLGTVFIGLFTTLLCPVPLKFCPTTALLVITPSRALLNLSAPTELNGPTVWLGLLGSCSRSSNSVLPECTTKNIRPKYNESLAALPPDAPSVLLEPFIFMPVFVITSIILASICFIAVALVAARLGTLYFGCPTFCGFLETFIEIKIVQWLIYWSVILSSFFVPATSFALYFWYQKSSQDFNASIKEQQGPEFIAFLGSGIPAGLLSSSWFLLHIFIIMKDCRRVAKGY